MDCIHWPLRNKRENGPVGIDSAIDPARLDWTKVRSQLSQLILSWEPLPAIAIIWQITSVSQDRLYERFAIHSSDQIRSHSSFGWQLVQWFLSIAVVNIDLDPAGFFFWNRLLSTYNGYQSIDRYISVDCFNECQFRSCRISETALKLLYNCSKTGYV